ncbi:AGRF5 protein, partial [Halcyon senegalensis]|nr:AGRF5 protein [Halcyon senegalensis]
VITFDLPPLEYTVDIEVSLTDSSFLEPIKEHFKNLNLPVSTNISNVEMTVSNISVTTVCLPNGENSSCCSCENGYAWPSTVCSELVTCPSVSLAPDLPCSYMSSLEGIPFNGSFCRPQTEDSYDMQEPVVMNMFVRLDISFQDNLTDSSSESHKTFKADLEKAFNASYRCLPGFVSATVIGFSPGSVFVNYELKAGAATFDQVANSNRFVQQFLDESYHLNQATFTEEKINQTSFTVSPEDISEGDTVRLICEINSTSENVTWYHSDHIISTSSRYLSETNVSRSILEIINITMKDSGSYGCTFTKSNQFHTVIYKATKTVTVSPFHVTPNPNKIDVICNSPEMQTKNILLSCCINRHLPSLTSIWTINGPINITGNPSFSDNCTEYQLNISDSLCPPEKSGTVTTYTCKMQTGHGAQHSQNISVMYLRRANITISSNANSSVPEGSSFNLTCESDVNNYDRISWKIQSGNEETSVECDSCIQNSSLPAMSVLTVMNATQDRSGTYICTFSQKHVESSANVTIKVVPLILKQNITIDPIEAFRPCNKLHVLQCCISANTKENYNVTFMFSQTKSNDKKKEKGNLFCYTYNYNETDCKKEKDIKAYCKFVNSVGQEVKSENITLHLIPGMKVSCSDSLGIGREGDTLKKPCHDNNNSNGFTRGNIIYKCSNKLWKPERNNCLSAEISELLTSAEILVTSPEAKAKLPTFLKTLKHKTESEKNTTQTSSANLAAIIDILNKVSSIPADAENTTIEDFLCTVNSIVTNPTSTAWEDLKKQDKFQSSLLLHSVESFSLHLQPVNNIIPSVSANTLQLQGIVVIENSSTEYSKNFTSKGNLTVKVFIDESEIQNLRQNSTIISVMYSNLGLLLPRNESECMNGLLISTTVSSNSSQKFNVNMTFAKNDSSLKMPRCVFWNFTLNKGSGGWDTRGCTPTEVQNDVICSCNHLTSFSILMSPDIDSHMNVESYITYIGLAISILSLAACIIIESLVWKYVTNNTTSYMRHVCILNIATSLLIADIWFIVTASIKDQKQQISTNFCLVAAFFIHLFYLCVFFWMLSLGLILFYRLVFILHNTSKTTQKAVAFCLGYGCPFVIAVITIAVTLPRKNYISEDACWLKWKDSKALLAFIIPALIIVAMNLFITAVVIVKILRPTIGHRSNRQERNSLFQIGKSVAILTPLLGLTWGFGIATTIKDSHQAFHILFSLLNAFQGLFILVFGALWDKKIQEALLKRNSVSKWSSQQSKSTSLILVTPMLAMSYPFARTFNNLCGRTGKYRVSSSEPSSSSSENTSKSYSLLN